MAYDALNSLAEKLELILDHDTISCFMRSRRYAKRRRFYCSFLVNSCFCRKRKCCHYCACLVEKPEIQSLHQNSVFLSSFLVDFPGEAANLEARITNAATQAEQHYYSFASRDEYVGFEEVLKEIKGRLYSNSSDLEIMPIVGMGGIGKTTLARHSYQDASSTHHFDVRAWATVSQNSSAGIILSSILSSIDPANKKKYRHMATELLVQHGHRYLKKRRYLIVMDDLWDTNVWDDVRMAFPDDCNGSRIIITTRDLDVASYVDSSNQPHNIQLMSVDQSWTLLKECS